MMNAAFDGTLKAMYIMGENPVITDPNMHHTIAALNRLDFLVVQDIFMTETAHMADVILPAACSFEKDGTFTNTERKVQRVRKVVEPPLRARDDLSVIMRVSRALGYPMEYDSAEQVFAEFGKLWPPMAGITYQRIDKRGLAWPCPTTDHPGTDYLYKDGFPVGKVQFAPVPFTPPAETASDEYPFVLTTGRNLFQYHSGSMTRRVATIERKAGEAYVEIHPSDGRKLGVANGDLVQVQSRRGKVQIKARLTRSVSPGTVFIPMHYREAAANVITNDVLDPSVKIPELKVCAVRIEALEKRAAAG
jgi:formate dehydrogenase major subunit